MRFHFVKVRARQAAIGSRLNAANPRKFGSRKRYPARASARACRVILRRRPEGAEARRFGTCPADPDLAGPGGGAGTGERRSRRLLRSCPAVLGELIVALPAEGSPDGGHPAASRALASYESTSLSSPVLVSPVAPLGVRRNDLKVLATLEDSEDRNL